MGADYAQPTRNFESTTYNAAKKYFGAYWKRCFRSNFLSLFNLN